MSQKNLPKDIFKYLDKTGSCWLWTRAKNRKGYGQFKVNGKLHITHRLMWSVHNGQIKEGHQVLHRCDVPSCCNPDHLFLGTNQDNVDDKMAKRRHKTFSRTSCKHGHPYDESTPKKPNKNGRRCLICERECMRRNYNPAKRAERYLASKEGRVR